MEREYKMGIADGIFKEYNPSGTLFMEGQLIKAQRKVTWKYYDEGETLVKERKFENNNQISETKYDR